MSRTLFALLIALAAALPAPARTALEFLAELPVEHFNVLSRNTRLDMTDYYNAGLQTPSDNIFGGKARILKATPNCVELLVAKNSLATLAVLPNAGDTVIAFIETVKTPTPDSSLAFFRASDWSPLTGVKLPVTADFMTPETRKAALTAADFPDMTFTSIEFDPETEVFTFRDRTRQHYALPEGSKPEYRALEYFRDTISRRLSKGRLTPVADK